MGHKNGMQISSLLSVQLGPQMVSSLFKKQQTMDRQRSVQFATERFPNAVMAT